MDDLILKVKRSLRITENNDDFDDEIKDLIDQAIEDLISSGVKPAAFSDFADKVLWAYSGVADNNLIRLIVLYSKAFFGLENPDKEWYFDQYQFKKAETLNQLTKYTNYTGGDVSV